LEKEVLHLLGVPFDFHLDACMGVSNPTCQAQFICEAIHRWTKPDALNSALQSDAKALGFA
jgi:hypothetical protein